ncbi:MAG: hypothetical protein QOD70_2106 [Frankiales bacterium]|jgi:MFS family permease|nr:hypothetical protein [Frankiales bacterium]
MTRGDARRAPLLTAVLPATSFRALRHPAYRRWAAADTASQLGTWAQALALSWVVLQLTGSTAALGGTVALQALPILLLGPWGGAAADRLPLRRLLLGTQIAQGVLAVALALLVGLGMASIGSLLVIALMQGLVQVLDAPAHALFTQQLVPEEDLPNAAALGSVTSSTGRVVGMALAGVGLGTLGAPGLFALNAVSFAAVALVVFRVRRQDIRPLPRAAGEDATVRAGLRYVLSRRELTVLLALVLVTSSLGRNFSVMTAALVNGPLHGGSREYAITSTAFAVGALGGALVATRLRALSLRVVLAAAGLAALGQVVAATSAGLSELSAVLVLVAAACVVLDTAIGSHLVLSTPMSLRGRVLALRSLVAAAAGAGGAPLLGWLADTSGARVTMGGAGALVLVSVVWAACRLRLHAVRASSWTGWRRELVAT